MKSEMSAHTRVYNWLLEATGLRLVEVEKLLKTLSV